MLDRRSLAAFRIVLGAACLFDVIHDFWPHAEALLTDGGLHPRRTFEDSFQDWQEWSIHAASGSLWWARLLLLLQGAAAAAVLVGWKTRAAMAVLWALHVSLLNRNQELWHGGDNAIDLWLWYGLWLPLGQVASVDALIARPRQRCPGPHSARAAAGALAFTSVLYAFYVVNALAKRGNTWRSTLDAVELSFRYAPLATPLAYVLSHYTQLCRALTAATVPLEALGPVVHGISGCMLATMKQGRGQGRGASALQLLRLLVVGAFVGLHASFLLCYRLGNFAPAMVAAWLAVVDGWVWDKLFGTAASEPHEPAEGGAAGSEGVSRAGGWRALCSAVFAVAARCWSALLVFALAAAVVSTALDDAAERVFGTAAGFVAASTGLNGAATASVQNYAAVAGARLSDARLILHLSMPRRLFADMNGEFYGTGGGWLVAAGVRRDGSVADFFPDMLGGTGGGAAAVQELRAGFAWPAVVADVWKSTRGQKFGERVQSGHAGAQPRWRLARWLCRRNDLRAVQLQWLTAEMLYAGRWAPPSLQFLQSVDCDDAAAPGGGEGQGAATRRSTCKASGEVPTSAGTAPDGDSQGADDNDEEECAWLPAEVAAKRALQTLRTKTAGANDYYAAGQKLAKKLAAGMQLVMTRNFFELTAGDVVEVSCRWRRLAKMRATLTQSACTHAQYITHREAMPPVLVRRLNDSSAGQTVWTHWTSLAIDVFSTKTPRHQLRRQLRKTLASLHTSLQRGARVRMRKPYAVRDGTGDMALEAGATGDLDSVYDIPFSESAEEGGSTSMAAEAEAAAALHGCTPQAHVRWDFYGGGAHWVYAHDLEVLPAVAASERAVALQRAFDAPLTDLPCFGDPCASIQTEFWQM